MYMEVYTINKLMISNGDLGDLLSRRIPDKYNPVKTNRKAIAPYIVISSPNKVEAKK